HGEGAAREPSPGRRGHRLLLERRVPREHCALSLPRRSRLHRRAPLRRRNRRLGSSRTAARRRVDQGVASEKMDSWPELSIARWRDTYATLLLCTQIVGKIRLALTPKTNEWWNVPLYVTTRGLTTSPMPYRDRTLSIDFDFIDHQLLVQDTDRHRRTGSLVPRRICDFHNAIFAEL